MGKHESAKLKKVTVSLPFGLGSAEWEADLTQSRAAWALYVELVTRVAVQELASDAGLVREALNSLYTLFGTTREILREAGPDVGASRESVGGLAIAVLNQGLRPFLTKWHPMLQAWEVQRPEKLSPKEHEQQWLEEPKLRQELGGLRVELEVYAQALAQIAGVDV
ncbi:MAG: hypothetical protein HC895_08090 [Leptolyngbyaceae cyanobacterium SM1_3_5]|nr:hypothetical protein [Leptolyngbyaceae cyanobacterium SM1_3_5]